jgi:hypothetical protein
LPFVAGHDRKALMLSIDFAGWVSCRLATDPDPFDDPRGTLSSFQQFAFAGEPDLDRVIRFHRPPFVRSHTWPVGVTVRRVRNDGVEDTAHPLAGAEVDLLDDPVLEGRNGAVAGDVREPINPVHLQVRRGTDAVSRAVVPRDPDYPFPDLMPLPGMPIPLSQIVAATGLSALVPSWQERLAKLEAELAAAPMADRPGLEERIALLRGNLASPGGGLAGMFRANMQWRLALDGPIQGDPAALFGAVDLAALDWTVAFWFGGYDTDAQMFFCEGTLGVPLRGEGPLLKAQADRRRAVRQRAGA